MKARPTPRKDAPHATMPRAALLPVQGAVSGDAYLDQSKTLNACSNSSSVVLSRSRELRLPFPGAPRGARLTSSSDVPAPGRGRHGQVYSIYTFCTALGWEITYFWRCKGAGGCGAGELCKERRGGRDVSLTLCSVAEGLMYCQRALSRVEATFNHCITFERR